MLGRHILFQVHPMYFHDGDPQKMKLSAWAGVFDADTGRIDATFSNGTPAEVIAEAMKVFPGLPVRTLDAISIPVGLREAWLKYAEDARAAMDSLLRGW